MQDQPRPALTDEGRAAIRRLRAFLLPLRIVVLLALVTLPAGGFPLAWAVPQLRLFLVMVGVMVAVDRAGITVDPSAASQDRGTKLLLIFPFFATLALAVYDVTHAAAAPTGAWAVRGPGLVAWVAGLALRRWSMATLGRFFTDRVRVFADHAVVTSGPYRFVRHPSYAGLALVMAGAPLVAGSWAAAVVSAVIGMVGIGLRVRVEERALRAHLGQPYADYAARTPRFLPRVHR
jgi:protein-S-isoprenylcysteine O-methyltransferase Ste14